MISGAVITASGWRVVPLSLSVQRAGLPQFIIQGLPAGVKKFRQDVFVALQHAGIKLPSAKVIVDLTLPQERVWGLEGLVAPVVLALSTLSRNQKKFQVQMAVGRVDFSGDVICPAELLSIVSQDRLGVRLIGSSPVEVSGGIQGEIFCASTIKQLVSGDWKPMNTFTPKLFSNVDSTESYTLPPIGDLHSLALSLVWAGGHSLLLFGAPGEGKTHSRVWLEALSPQLSPVERFSASSLMIVSPEALRKAPVIVTPATSNIREWESIPSGYFRKSSFGTIWLDELPETSNAVRLKLRSWLDLMQSSHPVADQICTTTAVVATMNPCPCGYWGEPRCTCQTTSVAGALRKVSLPLVDRFPLQWRVESPGFDATANTGQKLKALKARIAQARKSRQKRGQTLRNAQCEVWNLLPAVQSELRVWSHHCPTWSPRRQVYLAQIAQTLFDGGWATTMPEAFSLAWQLCRGAESLRVATDSREAPEAL